MIRPEDRGTAFGQWRDPVSRFMYYDALRMCLPKMNMEGTVVDFGGANGILKEFVPHAVTIDNDESKNPDIVADVLEFDRPFDVGFCRYVLHYLTTSEAVRFLRKAPVRRLYVMQFVNNDLVGKYANSRGEGLKFFRTRRETDALFGSLCSRVLWESPPYTVDTEFYRNRLGIEGCTPHREQVVLYEVLK